MQITVSSRHTEVSDALREVAVEKIGRLTRFLDGMDHAEVHFFEEPARRADDKEVCEVTLEGHGHHVRCKVHGPDGFVAVDRAVEKLEHQLHKLKTKLQRRHIVDVRRAKARANGNGNGAASISEEDEEEMRAGGPRIVKAKRFDIKPMTPEEAALQLELVGHDFFLFTNSRTNRAALVYRRKDGDLGLIDEAS